MEFKNWDKIQKLIFGELVERFEDKLLIYTTLAISAILTVSTAFNIYMELKSAIVISTILGIFIYFSLFLFGRFINRGVLFYWITCIISIVYTDLIWFFNYGSEGPVMPLFVVLYAFLILVFDKKYFYYISILLYLNLLGLLLIELGFNEKFGTYPDLTISEGKDLKIIVHSDDNSLEVKADPVRLEQIFRNLLSNAIKFTEKGTIEMGYSKSPDFYTFYVKDCGIGLHPEHHHVIFDRFMKIDNDKQHLYRGTGIGLYLSKQLVEMFGGKIWLESEFGKGACFYFTIPVQPVEMSHSLH